MGVIGVMGFRVWRFRDLNNLNFGRMFGAFSGPLNFPRCPL